MSQIHFNQQLETLKKESVEQADNPWLPFAIGYRLLVEGRLLEEGYFWEGEYYLLQAVERGSHLAAAFLAYHKLGLAELDARLRECSSAIEAQSLLHRQAPQQFIEIVSCRADLQGALHDLVVWAKQGSLLALSIDALQRTVAGDRTALKDLSTAVQNGLPQARVWLFLLRLDDALDMDDAIQILGPYLNESWAQRWIGSAFLHKNESEALTWLWRAAASGDASAHHLLVNELRRVDHWDSIHQQALAELMQRQSHDAYHLAAQLNKGVFSKLHIDYLKEAQRLGRDTEIELRHAQSKIFGVSLLSVAAAIVCLLVQELPTLTAILPIAYVLFRFWKDRQSDSEFMRRFDGVTLQPRALAPQVVQSGVSRFENDILDGNEGTWNNVIEHAIEHAIEENMLHGDSDERKGLDLSFWDLKSISNWDELWRQPLSQPWHQVWLDVDQETCLLALSGAPQDIKETALADLSTANQLKQRHTLNRLGYLPLSLCLPAIQKIHHLKSKESMPSS